MGTVPSWPGNSSPLYKVIEGAYRMPHEWAGAAAISPTTEPLPTALNANRERSRAPPAGKSRGLRDENWRKTGSARLEKVGAPSSPCSSKIQRPRRSRLHPMAWLGRPPRTRYGPQERRSPQSLAGQPVMWARLSRSIVPPAPRQFTWWDVWPTACRHCDIALLPVRGAPWVRGEPRRHQVHRTAADSGRRPPSIAVATVPVSGRVGSRRRRAGPGPICHRPVRPAV